MRKNETYIVNPTADQLDLPAEAVLDPTIQFQAPLSNNLQKPKSIFLTGATGFLGAYLLNELLHQTTADIHYLIRCGDLDTGKQRLKSHLQFYSLWSDKFNSRIIPILGDLSKPLLGLSQEKFRELAGQLDVIYHNGAWVNSACPYSTLKATNVLGTQEVIRLASLTKTKPVHFISTAAVFFSPAYSQAQEISETDIPDLATLKGGYRQSKAVAEQLVRIAQDRGLPACIYRPSRIMGDSQTGINGNTQDFFCSLLKGCIKLEKFPALETATNLVPVDYVAQAIVNLSGQEKSLGKAFHLLNPQPLPWAKLFDEICSLGYSVEKVTYDKLLAAVEHQASKSPEDEFYSSLLLLLSSPGALLNKKPPFGIVHTLEGLAGTSIACPPMDKKIIATYCNYFQKSGYLPVASALSEVNGASNKPAKKTSGFWKSIRTNIKSKNRAFSIKPVPRDGKLPLSFGQERLWLIDQLQPGNPVHNLRGAFRLKGALNIAVLEKSIQEIVRRHEILRTTFREVNGQPVQVISPALTIELPLVNLEGLPTEQQEEEVQLLAKKVAQQPFDLAEGPLIRVKLLRLAEEEYVLLRTIHHIINDVWSNTVFMRELATIYEAFCTGKPSPLPELSIQYVDFAQSQRQWLQGEVLTSQLDYWKQQLSGVSVLQLPTDYSPPTAPNYRGAAQYLLLSKRLTKAIKELQNQEGVSLFVILLAAFKTLLYQYSGQEDIILCSPVAGRQQMVTKKLLGYFSNIVLIRTNLAKNPSFRELLSRVNKVHIGVIEHQHLPFQELVESVGVPSTTLSRAMFTLQNVPSQPKEIAGIGVSFLDMEEGIANFDLSLSMKEKEEQLIGVLRYKTDLFRESTVKQMLDNFQILLEAFVANPEQHLSDLPIFAEAKPSQVPNQPVEPAYLAPQNERELAIAAIWQEVLQVEKVGIHANFFDIGGRSLAMVRVYTKLREIFDCEISVVELFKYPTISGMAEYLSLKHAGNEP